MKIRNYLPRVIVGLFLSVFACLPGAFAQGILNKTISLEVNRQRLDKVLQLLSNKGDFYFSYNSTIVKGDSLVSLLAYNKTIRQVLDQLFSERYEYEESGNYIIIRKKPVKLSFITDQGYTAGKAYVVSGYVLDEESGERISDASIYEEKQLVSALTDKEGHFEIRLKRKPLATSLTVSKQFYEDTTVVVKRGYNQQVTIAIAPVELSAQLVTVSPGDYLYRDSIIVRIRGDSILNRNSQLINSYSGITGITVGRRLLTMWEKNKRFVRPSLWGKPASQPLASPPQSRHNYPESTKVARLMLSTRQKIQSLNLKQFFTERPFQVSLLPGLSTHGPLNSQVINKVSLNILGGYSGGVNGVEMAHFFNIDRKSVRYVQLAGWFNIVGGSVEGLQAAGIHNLVLDSVRGVQYAGISNFVKGRFTGTQASGIYNHVSDSFAGAQLAGIANFTRKQFNGFQAAGIANVSAAEMKGVQVAGIINYTKKLKGVQLGLINIADTSEGYSIGIVNIVLKGYHQLIFSSNEITNTNFAFKTGNRKLYSILMAGMQTGSRDKLYTFGYGIGRAFPLNERWSVAPELLSQHLYLGSWHHLNLLNRFNLDANLRLGKNFSLSAGPSFSMYYSTQPSAIPGYKFDITPTGYHAFNMGSSVKGWFGWNASINIF